MESQPDLAVLTLRQAGAFACPVGYGLLELTGADASRFLQSRTSNDVAALTSGSGQASSVLDRKAHIEAYFSLHRLDDSFWIVAEREQISTLVEQLGKFIFNEKVEIADRSSHGLWAAVQGSFARKLLAQAMNIPRLPLTREYDIARLELWGCRVLLVKRSITGEEGFLIWVAQEEGERFQEHLMQSARENKFPLLSEPALEIARVEAGIPRYGVDMSLENSLPETGLEEFAVSYTKGCYLGQEVIARVKTFGAPRRGLCGLEFAEGIHADLPFDEKIMLSGHEIGTIKSSVFSPSLQRTVTLAYLNKEQRVPDQDLSIDVGGKSFVATVKLLPFVNAVSAEERAGELYKNALSEFATGDEKKAIAGLREALLLDPFSADLYETLGVILSKHGQLDEAISLMKKLAELDSESIMAHANLSVFYLEQGNKEAAEEEKAIAMSIRMQKLAREADLQKQEEKSQQQSREEALERMGMFAQVLEIDGEDLLANYGLGSIHVELKEFDRAIPYLCKAISVKPTHTVAYLALGAAYQGLNQTEQAADIYKKGIEVAAKRGDMTPLKEMQLRLSQIEKGL